LEHAVIDHKVLSIKCWIGSALLKRREKKMRRLTIEYERLVELAVVMGEFGLLLFFDGVNTLCSLGKGNGGGVGVEPFRVRFEPGRAVTAGFVLLLPPFVSSSVTSSSSRSKEAKRIYVGVVVFCLNEASALSLLSSTFLSSKLVLRILQTSVSASSSK